jgi:hypothetical protein
MGVAAHPPPGGVVGRARCWTDHAWWGNSIPLGSADVDTGHVDERCGARIVEFPGMLDARWREPLTVLVDWLATTPREPLGAAGT